MDQPAPTAAQAGRPPRTSSIGVYLPALMSQQQTYHFPRPSQSSSRSGSPVKRPPGDVAGKRAMGDPDRTLGEAIEVLQPMSPSKGSSSWGNRTSSARYSSDVENDARAHRDGRQAMLQPRRPFPSTSATGSLPPLPPPPPTAGPAPRPSSPPPRQGSYGTGPLHFNGDSMRHFPDFPLPPNHASSSSHGRARLANGPRPGFSGRSKSYASLRAQALVSTVREELAARPAGPNAPLPAPPRLPEVQTGASLTAYLPTPPAPPPKQPSPSAPRLKPAQSLGDLTARSRQDQRPAMFAPPPQVQRGGLPQPPQGQPAPRPASPVKTGASTRQDAAPSSLGLSSYAFPPRQSAAPPPPPPASQKPPRADLGPSASHDFSSSPPRHRPQQRPHHGRGPSVASSASSSATRPPSLQSPVLGGKPPALVLAPTVAQRIQHRRHRSGTSTSSASATSPSLGAPSSATTSSAGGHQFALDERPSVYKGGVDEDATPRAVRPTLQPAAHIAEGTPTAMRLPFLNAGGGAGGATKDAKASSTLRARSKSFTALATAFSRGAATAAKTSPAPLPPPPMPSGPSSAPSPGEGAFATWKGKLKGKPHAAPEPTTMVAQPNQHARRSSVWSLSDDEGSGAGGFLGRKKKTPTQPTTTPPSRPKSASSEGGKKHRSRGPTTASGFFGTLMASEGKRKSAPSGVRHVAAPETVPDQPQLRAPPLTPSASASTSSAASIPSTPPGSRPSSRASRFKGADASSTPGSARSRSRQRSAAAEAAAEYAKMHQPTLEDVYRELSRATAHDVGGRYAGIGMADGLWGTPRTLRRGAEGMGSAGGVRVDEMGVVMLAAGGGPQALPHVRSWSGPEMGWQAAEDVTLRARLGGGELPLGPSKLATEMMTARSPS